MAAIAGVERRFSHQTVHAGLGAQPAIGVVAGHADGRALDAGHLAGALIDDFGLDAVRIRPFQVHAQQHGRPVLGFGAAGACLNVEKGIVRIHLAGEHALEFQLLDLEGQSLGVGLDSLDGVRIRLGRGQIQQLSGIGQGALEPIKTADDLLELGAFLSQFLGAIGIVPDAWLLELALYFLKTFEFVVVIKDTSSKSRCAPRDL